MTMSIQKSAERLLCKIDQSQGMPDILVILLRSKHFSMFLQSKDICRYYNVLCFKTFIFR